jgi:hypothetical protein
MYLCVAIDGAQSEGPQEEGFEDVPEQQQYFEESKWSLIIFVVEPLELFWLKCASRCYTADTNSTHFKRNNSMVCRVTARCNHSSTGLKQVYLARRRVYKCTPLINF